MTPDGVTQAYSNTTSVGGVSPSVPFDTTAGHTFQIKAEWSGTFTGQYMTTYRTKLARRD